MPVAAQPRFLAATVRAPFDQCSGEHLIAAPAPQCVVAFVPVPAQPGVLTLALRARPLHCGKSGPPRSLASVEPALRALALTRAMERSGAAVLVAAPPAKLAARPMPWGKAALIAALQPVWGWGSAPGCWPRHRRRDDRCGRHPAKKACRKAFRTGSGIARQILTWPGVGLHRPSFDW